MQIFFALFLPTISQAIQCNEGLKLRESASQCWDKNILQTRQKYITSRNALASLPGIRWLNIRNMFTWVLSRKKLTNHYSHHYNKRGVTLIDFYFFSHPPRLLIAIMY